MKKFLKWTGIILLCIITALYVYIIANQKRKFEAPYPDIKSGSDSALIARGKALVFGPAHCANCHGPEELQKEVAKGVEVPLSGGTKFELPIGNLYSKNLTPHATGIGSLTDAEIARALRYGIRKDGTALFDFMPFHNTSDEDLSAIISYLRTQKPVNNPVPENDLNLLGQAVSAFIMKPAGPTGEVPQSVKKDTSAEYGEYLAGSVANCRGCHTNRNLMTGEFTGEDYAGGLKFDVKTDSGTYSLTTPNLTPHVTGRLNGWTQQHFIERFRKGSLNPYSHMPWGPFSRMSDDELTAIYKFLKTVKPVDNAVKLGLQKEE